MLVLLLAAIVLAIGALGPAALQAHANRAQLDHELTHARIALGIPDRLLTPITSQEQRVTGGAGGLFSNYQEAATTYRLLYTHLLSIEQTAQQTLQQQAQADLQACAAILTQRHAEGFSEVAAYQARFDEALQDYDQAKTPADFAHVSDIATAQTLALQAMWPAYEKLQNLQALIKSLHDAGSSAQLAQRFYDEDLQVFRSAASAAHYQALTGILDAQIMQVLLDETSAQPYIMPTRLHVFQASIDLLRRYGDTTDAASFQQQHDDDATHLAAASHLSDYQSLARTIATQNAAMAPLLIKAKAAYDLTILRRLVDYAQTQTVINPADHQAYPIAPEYADRYVGIGDAANKLSAARTLEQYQGADFEITSLAMGLRAQLDDRTDPTAHDQPHQTDLQVMQYYNVTAGRVAIISLAEQTARFYENGTLVYWSYVTTGRPEHPSAPGYHVAMVRLSPTLFVSQAPRGSPEWYAPTPIHYAIEYNIGYTRSGGDYFLHDAWWRSQFGPYTNLPHHDPAAFNGGSLGCVNFPLATMQWVYPWTLLGTPIILY
jgi:L,D-transpeptidase catalytic domain